MTPESRRTRWSCWIAGLLCLPSLAAADQGAFLRWDFGPPVPSETAPQYKLCHPVSVSWLDGQDRVVWTTPLPERVRANAGLCDCRKADGSGPCAAELRTYQEDPRGSTPPFVIGVKQHGRAVVIADPTGLLVLDRASGKILLDRPDDDTGGPSLFFDRGRWKTEPACQGRARHARFLAACGDKLLTFNGRTAVVLEGDPLRATDSTRYDPSKHHRQGVKIPRVDVRIPLGGTVLVLEGIVYLR